MVGARRWRVSRLWRRRVRVAWVAEMVAGPSWERDWVRRWKRVSTVALSWAIG